MNPKANKSDRERSQVITLLEALGIDHGQPTLGADPPDVVVPRRGMTNLYIEVREYHPERDRVGMEHRWKQIKGRLENLIRERDAWKGVILDLSFLDQRLPQARHHEAIVFEVVTLTEWAIGAGLLGQDKLEFCPVPGLHDFRLSPFQPPHYLIPIEKWPVLGEHLAAVGIQHSGLPYRFPVRCHWAQTAWCSPYAEAFRVLFEQKDHQIRKAIEEGKNRPEDGPLWLLVVCNNRDLSSYIFGEWEQLAAAIEGSNYDLVASPFEQVWLLSEDPPGRAFRLYPWGGSRSDERAPSSTRDPASR